ncbi:hypothetical protein CN367_04280 [Priestia megaterium]|uniref:hypothetical protein n=1 Tax=Priestia TaxID=2800373 RepID=UPI000BF303FE|nr:hypothetical protein [Priestia megaterium]MCJ7983198.1 hypothetical protein [Priestia sp. OVL9]PEW10131.1 hypothetical protein CN435_26530 [Priestia megaterium]PEZ49454.1 hypothetical protein CN367_04280 [Priestia megaterium]PGN01494.1 hypothetical protein CN955_25050 [Priestia megaterium]PGQ86625.1 hypothetical protein COA18_10355 [Priestia megaterium]
MSLATYIGTNVELPINDGLNDVVTIESCFSDERHRLDIQKHHFTTPYVYEVSSDWGIEITDYMNKSRRKESKEKLLALCKLVDPYLTSGDFFELYSCWIGEEAKEQERKLTLNIHYFDIDGIYMPEKTLVRIEK